MALRGVDAQLMITRTAELTKEAGRTQRSHEVSQEQLAERAKAEDRRKREQVQGTQRSEAARIRERQSGGQGSRQGGGRGETGKEPEENGKNSATEHIDIKI